MQKRALVESASDALKRELPNWASFSLRWTSETNLEVVLYIPRSRNNFRCYQEASSATWRAMSPLLPWETREDPTWTCVHKVK